MRLYPLIIPLGNLSFLLILATFLSGFPKGRRWRWWHIRLAWIAMLLVVVHGALVLYLRYL